MIFKNPYQQLTRFNIYHDMFGDTNSFDDFHDMNRFKRFGIDTFK